MLEEPLIEEGDVGTNAPALTRGIDPINAAIRALYIHKKEASYKEIAAPSGLHPAVASQALSSSKDLGLTRSAGKKGWYLLSSNGVEYARYLTENRFDECKKLLKEIIIGNPLWTDVVVFLRTNEGTARDPLDLIMNTVEKKLGKQWSPAMRRTVSDSTMSALEYSGLIRRESGKIVSLVGPNDAPSQQEPKFMAQPTRASTTASHPKNANQAEGYYEFAGDGFYLRVRKDPLVIGEAYEHLHLIMKRNIQQATSNQSEAKVAVSEGVPQ